jgi:DNA-directed RNA polymerase specialized sigma24 family protein
MLENSLWLRYNPNKTMREVLARIYECSAVEVNDDERVLYASLKRHLTKKELRMIIMNEAEISAEEIAAEVGMNTAELKKAQYKAYRKIRQEKIRNDVKAGPQSEAVVEVADEE